jgi:hypothetical protein
MTHKSKEITTYTEEAFTQGALRALGDGTPYMVDAIANGFSPNTGEVHFQPVLCGKPFGEGVFFPVVGMKVTYKNAVVCNSRGMMIEAVITNYEWKFEKTDLGCRRIFTVSLNAGGSGNHFCEGVKWNNKRRSWFTVERLRFSLFLTLVDDLECLFRYFKLKWNPISKCWKVIIIESHDPFTPLMCRKKRETRGQKDPRLYDESPRPFNCWNCRINPDKCGCPRCKFQRDDAMIGMPFQIIVIKNPDCDCVNDEKHDGDCYCDCHRKCDCNRKCNNPFPCECYCHRNSGGEASDGNDEASDGNDEASDGNDDDDGRGHIPEWQPTPFFDLRESSRGGERNGEAEEPIPSIEEPDVLNFSDCDTDCESEDLYKKFELKENSLPDVELYIRNRDWTNLRSILGEKIPEDQDDPFGYSVRLKQTTGEYELCFRL